MADDLNQVCDEHPNRHDCPAALIHYLPNQHEYGLYIHDGGSSIVTIMFCPWCGTDLRRFARQALDAQPPTPG